MTTRRGSHRQGTEGQVLVLVAGGFIAFVAIVGLVVDGGVAFLNRRDGQNGADLASLAGARMITEHYMSGTTRTTDQVYDAVAASLNSNNCVAAGGTPCAFTATYVASTGGTTPTTIRTTAVTDGTTSTVPTGTIGVAVDVQRTPRTYFSAMLGVSSWTVGTSATAITTRYSSVPPGVLLPIAICGWQSTTTPNDCSRATGPGDAIEWQHEQIYDLTDGVDAPGGFGYLSWTGSNAAGDLAESLRQSSNPAFSLDSPYDDPGTKGVIGTNPATGETWFPVDTGKSNKGDVRKWLNTWIESGKEVLIPIYDIVEGTGNNAWYHITGVAAFKVVSQEQPAVDNIQAMFLKYYTLSDVPGGLQLPPTPADTTVNLRIVR